jgi:hypothetical protein
MEGWNSTPRSSLNIFHSQDLLINKVTPSTKEKYNLGVFIGSPQTDYHPQRKVHLDETLSILQKTYQYN